MPGMRIYTHTAARLPPSSVLVFCKAGLPQPSTWYGCLYQPGTAGVGAAPTVWCLGCGTPTVGVAVGGRRHAPVPPSLLRGVHRPSINRIYRPTTRNDFKLRFVLSEELLECQQGNECRARDGRLWHVKVLWPCMLLVTCRRI